MATPTFLIPKMVSFVHSSSFIPSQSLPETATISIVQSLRSRIFFAVLMLLVVCIFRPGLENTSSIFLPSSIWEL
jgi:hypothetical protein